MEVRLAGSSVKAPFGDAVDGMPVGKLGQNIPEVGFRVQTVEFRRRDECADGSRPVAARIRTARRVRDAGGRSRPLRRLAPGGRSAPWQAAICIVGSFRHRRSLDERRNLVRMRDHHNMRRTLDLDYLLTLGALRHEGM